MNEMLCTSMFGQVVHTKPITTSTFFALDFSASNFESRRLVSRFLSDEDDSDLMYSTNRKPRKVDSYRQSKPEFQFFQEQDALEVLPREIKFDQLPSTPQLNGIMDRAMGKVKTLLRELEKEKGKEGSFIHVNMAKKMPYIRF